MSISVVQNWPAQEIYLKKKEIALFALPFHIIPHNNWVKSYLNRAHRAKVFKDEIKIIINSWYTDYKNIFFQNSFSLAWKDVSLYKTKDMIIKLRSTCQNGWEAIAMIPQNIINSVKICGSVIWYEVVCGRVKLDLDYSILYLHIVERIYVAQNSDSRSPLP